MWSTVLQCLFSSAFNISYQPFHIVTVHCLPPHYSQDKLACLLRSNIALRDNNTQNKYILSVQIIKILGSFIFNSNERRYRRIRIASFKHFMFFIITQRVYVSHRCYNGFCVSCLSRVNSARTKESNIRVESRVAFHCDIDTGYLNLRLFRRDENEVYFATDILRLFVIFRLNHIYKYRQSC